MGANVLRLQKDR